MILETNGIIEFICDYCKFPLAETKELTWKADPHDEGRPKNVMSCYCQECKLLMTIAVQGMKQELEKRWKNEYTN